jgi:uncharacterized coiled-coil DUF342 family protein
MPLFKESKDSLRASIDELKFLKEPIVQQIKDLTEQRLSLIAKRDDIQAKIDKLQTDLNNG